MTREQAIAIARSCAYRHWGEHDYLTGFPIDFFQPHEWVIESILAAAELAASESD